jgi:Tfp pilus assembly protein PilN
MRRMDLLPVTYVERRRQRRDLFTVVVIGFVLAALLFMWMAYLLTQISTAESDLQAVQDRNRQLEEQIAELQHFADLDAEVNSKRTALQTVMAGDIDWPAVMTEIAMVIPGDAWLESLTTSAGQTEGSAPVGTEGNAIRITKKAPAGRIQFTGNAICMPGVAKWLVRLGTVKDFTAIWLNSATEADTRPGCEIVDFDSTVELSESARSDRFQGELE